MNLKFQKSIKEMGSLFWAFLFALFFSLAPFRAMAWNGQLFHKVNRLENPMAPPVDGGDINGGFTIRPSLMDFDGDGDLDLYLSDHTKIRFYENIGTSTSPSFLDRSHDAKNLFSDITGPGHISQGFYDVDKDGLTDLILGNWTGGLYYYENRGTQQNPQYASYYWNPADARVSGHAAPTAADLNGNGRAEIYIGAENGKIRCFEVVRVLENSDNCMGWVFQAPEFEEKTGAHNPLSGISLSGRITPHLTDFDGDGDTDLFVGTQLGQVAYYKNTGTTSRPNFVRQQESSDLFRGIDLRGNAITNVATPTTGDLNGDGKKDVLVVVNDGDIRWFKNTGTTANPSLTQVTGTENPFGGVDLGQKTHPALIDNDGDGDLDLYVGVCRGIYTEGVTWGDDVGNNQGRIRYFKNVGTSSAPVYRQTPSENKFKTFSSKGVSKISFADVDGDNDKDAVIVDTYGEVFYYKNQAAPNATPHFVKKTGDKDPFHGLSSYPDSFYGPPAFADFDGDGDMDFFVASIGGYDLMYFKNTPQNGKPHFERAPDNEIPFQGVVTTKWTVPLFFDMDRDGDTDALFAIYIGGIGSQMRFYENKGTRTTPRFDEEPVHTKGWINDPTPVLGDMDGDGDLDMFVGNALGTLSYLENKASVPPSNLSLSSTQIPVEMLTGETIGQLSCTNPETDENVGYALVSGHGDTHNGFFSIQGTALNLDNPPTLVPGRAFSIRIRAFDAAGGYVERALTLIVDADATRKGDLNRDGLVNMKDAAICLDILSHGNSSGLHNWAITTGADVDGDGKVGIAESIYILQKAAELR